MTSATRNGVRVLAVLRHPAATGVVVFGVVLLGFLLSYNVDKPTHNADWYIRYQVTCSIVEHNAFNINPYDGSRRTGPGIDGRNYAQYTLGQSVAMVPLYMLGRIFAGVSHTNCDAQTANTIVFLTCKSLDLFLGALLCALLFATARLLGYSRRTALTVTLVLAFCTSLWPDVLSNEEHTMESLFLLTAAYAALRYSLQRNKCVWWLVAMGIAAGLVFVTRVSGIVAVPIFAIYLAVFHRRDERGGDSVARPRRQLLVRDIGLFAAGLLPSVIVNGAYDALRFGSPFRTGPYPDQTFGYPPWLGLPNLLISPGKGLIWYSPAVLLLVVAALAFWRRWPMPSILFAIICGGYLLFYSNVNYWHGDPAWGPRYLYAILPYLTLPLAELLERWPAYRLRVRGLLVAVLAASFLVQLSAVTVSYWRHWFFIYGYHHNQVEDHGWGSSMNFWWSPEQSPVLYSLAGIVDITEKYLDHAPLLWHSTAQRLADPRESSIYAVVGQAAVYLTDVDKLQFMGNWNTFTPWWLHAYPWWPPETVARLALGLLALWFGSVGLAIAATAAPRRPTARLIRLARDSLPEGSPTASVVPPDPLDWPVVSPPPASGDGGAIGSASPSQPGVGSSAAVAIAPSLIRTEVASAPRAGSPAAGLRQLGLASLLGAASYGALVIAGVAMAPRYAQPVVHSAASSATVRDGDWGYQVLGANTIQALPGGAPTPVDSEHQFAVVRLRLHNYSIRAQQSRSEWFDLTDAAGLRYPLRDDVRKQIAELYHLIPAGSQVPARSSIDVALVFEVRTSSKHFSLVGPGITLMRIAS